MSPSFSDLFAVAVTLRLIAVQTHIDFFHVSADIEYRLFLAGRNAGYDAYCIFNRPGKPGDSAGSDHRFDEINLFFTRLADGCFYLKVERDAVSIVTVEVAMPNFADLNRPSVLRVKHAGIAAMDNTAKFAKRCANLVLKLCLAFRMNHLRIPFACAILYTHPGA